MPHRGPRSVFTDHLGSEGSFGSTIFVVDVSLGSFTTLDVVPADWQTFEPVVAGDTIAWIERGKNRWRLRVRDATGAIRTLDSGSGVNREIVRLDPGDGLVAYGVPADSAGTERIRVRRLEDGSLVREIRVPNHGQLYKVAISQGNVFFSAGSMNADQMMRTAVAWLSVADRPEPVKVADAAFELAIDGSVLAYVSDPKGDRAWTVVIEDWTTGRVLFSTPDPHADTTILRSMWPAAGDGIVCWIPEWNRLSAELAVWSPTSSAALNVAKTQAGQCGLARAGSFGRMRGTASRPRRLSGACRSRWSTRRSRHPSPNHKKRPAR